MKTFMNVFIALSALCLLVPAKSFSGEGTNSGGGGDLCENRIQIIRDDIKSWIVRGGHLSLKLPNGISTQDYEIAMLYAMNAAKIRCVAPGDNGYPVQVFGTPKECRFDKRADLQLITCDINKLLKSLESDQYVLIHHELAGLAGLENPSGDVSTYSISNQITSYLVDQVVKKLAIVPVQAKPTDKIFKARENGQDGYAAARNAVNMALHDCILETGSPQSCVKIYESPPTAKYGNDDQWYDVLAAYRGAIPVDKKFSLYVGISGAEKESGMSLRVAEDEALRNCVFATGDQNQCHLVWADYFSILHSNSKPFRAKAIYRANL